MENTKINLLCEQCGKVFTAEKNLKKHISSIHSSHEKYICHCCGKEYSNKSNLIRHISKCTNTNGNKKQDCNKDVKVECVICKKYKDIKSNLLKHYRVEHSINMLTEDVCFSSFLEFEKWKDEMEENTVSKYVRCDLRKSNNKIMYYYGCNRSGFYKSKGKKKRRLKLKGSNKINGYCPSRINVTINKTTEEVHVHFVKTHVGHTMDLEKIPLKKADRDLLASKICQKIPFDELLNDTRDDFDQSINVSRIHLLTRKDLFNIKQLYNLKRDSVRHTNDCFSVESTNKNSKLRKKLTNKDTISTLETSESANSSDNSLVIDKKYENFDNEEESILKQLCRPETSRTCDVTQYKEKLSHMFDRILDTANTIEQCKLIDKALDPLQSKPTLDVLKDCQIKMEFDF